MWVLRVNQRNRQANKIDWLEKSKRIRLLLVISSNSSSEKQYCRRGIWRYHRSNEIAVYNSWRV